MILIEPYLDFLIEHDLTQDQFLLLQLLYEARPDLIKRYKKKFPNEDGTMISSYLLKDLIKKEFLIIKDKRYRLGTKFLDIYVTPERATNEIYSIYPAFIVKDNGVQIPLTSMDRNIFKKIYISKIQCSLQEHREVIKDIKYGVQSNKIKIGLNKFLTSEQWKVFRKERAIKQVNNIDKDF